MGRVTEFKHPVDEDNIKFAEEFLDMIKNGEVNSFAIIYYKKGGLFNHHFKNINNRFELAGMLDYLKVEVLENWKDSDE